MLSERELDRLSDMAMKDNAKNGWSFTEETMWRLLMRHKYGNDAAMYYVEERLEDANFHSTCELVQRGLYDAAMLDFYSSGLVDYGYDAKDIEECVAEYFAECAC